MKQLLFICLLSLSVTIIKAGIGSEEKVVVDYKLIIDEKEQEFADKICKYRKDHFFDQETLWNTLSVDKIFKDAELKAFFECGLAYLKQWGVTKQILNALIQYFCLRVNLVQQRQCNETLILVDLTLSSPDGDCHRFQVIVYKDPCTGQFSVVEVNYVKSYFSTPGREDFFTDYSWDKSLTWDNFQKDKWLQKLFFGGINYLVLEAIKECLIDKSNYSVTELYSIAFAEAGRYTYYFFDSNVLLPGSVEVEVFFVVKVDEKTGKKEMKEFDIVKLIDIYN